MSKLLIVLIVALFFEATGVIFLSKGLKEIGEVQKVSVPEMIRIIGRGLTNWNVLLGVALEATFFGALLYLLSQRDVSLIWPLTALGFVVTTLAAKYILKEQVDWVRWCGVALIVGGAALITFSEKRKERKASAAEPRIAEGARASSPQ